MTAKTPDRRESDLEIIARYTDQPERLPRDLRQRIEREWGGLPVQLYGMADLDSSMRFARTWLALGPGHIALAHQSQGAGRSEIRVFERSAIRAVRRWRYNPKIENGVAVERPGVRVRLGFEL